MARSSRRAAFEDRTAAERITFIASLVVLAAIVGGLLAIELSRGNEPPRITVDARPQDATEHDGTWYVPVTITNDGDLGAEHVRVDLLRDAGPDAAPEVADFSHDFLAPGERVEGLAAFDEQPAAEDLTVDVVSILQP